MNKERYDFRIYDIHKNKQIDKIAPIDFYLEHPQDYKVYAYTGKKDSNLQKIYENDQLFITDGFYSHKDGVFKVQWNKNHARFELVNGNDVLGFDQLDTEKNCKISNNPRIEG